MTSGHDAGLFAGFRILDLCGLRGGYAGRLFADLGADVIKVEPPSGDPMRSQPPFAGNVPHPEKSLQFFFYNLNKRSITLNLETDRGRDLFLRLLRSADGLIEDADVGYLHSLALDYAALRAAHPRLVMLSITDFGQTGPRASWRSSDLVNMAMSGFMQASGETDGPPQRLGMNHSYVAAGLAGAYGMATALLWQRRTGAGQYVDVSALEAAAVFISDKGQAPVWNRLGINQVRAGRNSHSNFPNGLFPTKDGWIALIAMSEPNWNTLVHWIVEVTGDDKWLEPVFQGPRHARAPYIDLLSDWLVNDFLSRITAKEFFYEGSRRGLTAVPVYTVEEIARDSHLEARRFFREVHHPIIGTVRFPRLPYYSAEFPWRVLRPAPLLGEHNDEVYSEGLGFSTQELASLRASGVI